MWICAESRDHINRCSFCFSRFSRLGWSERYRPCHLCLLCASFVLWLPIYYPHILLPCAPCGDARIFNSATAIADAYCSRRTEGHRAVPYVPAGPDTHPHVSGTQADLSKVASLDVLIRHPPLQVTQVREMLGKMLGDRRAPATSLETLWL